MARRIQDLAREVVAAPLGDVIAAVGEGVAAAQQALDEGSVARTLEIHAEGGDEALEVLRRIGYRPTFYALPETTGEVRVSLSLGSTAAGAATPAPTVRRTPAVSVGLSRVGRTVGVAPKIYATPVDGGYANRYGYRANISAKLTFRIVPVPAPDGADELRLVPDLTSRPVADAVTALESLGLLARVLDAAGVELEALPDAGKVARQEPAPDTVLRAGDLVTLVLDA
ncbi:MAG: PASTA domain-containing protein [Pseudomonadales bacterium]|jgi:hypothetical protein|nr:PASTA domain-containing protein [Pseudomonadales bacterium]